jgi:hypothetical protein
MIDSEEDVLDLIAQAEKHCAGLIEATKKQIAYYQDLADRAESEEEQRQYLRLALEAGEKSRLTLEDTRKRINSVRELLAQATSTHH